MKKALLPAGLALCLLLPYAASAAEKLNTLLVVPARKVMVQLAFDMQSLRHAEVVSWATTSDPQAPDLYYWTGAKWDPITLAQFRAGDRLVRKPQKTIFLGLAAPAVLTDAAGNGIARFETFDTAVLINNLDAFYAFNDAEWRLLSKRYNFAIYDANARLRKQNRYTQPQPEEPKVKRTPVIFNNPPPAQILREKPAARPAPFTRLDTVPKAEPPKAEVIAPATVEPAPVKAEPVKVEPVKVESEPVKVEPEPVVTATEPVTVETAPEAAPVKVMSAPIKVEAAKDVEPAAAPATEPPTVIESKPAAAPEAK